MDTLIPTTVIDVPVVQQESDSMIPLYVIWSDENLKGNVTAKFCIDCDGETFVEYVGSYRKLNGEIFDIYECLHRKHRVFSFERERVHIDG